jgi:hypothetical protein
MSKIYTESSYEQGRLRCQVCGFVQKDYWPDERIFHATKHWRGVFVTCGYYECFHKLDGFLEPQQQNERGQRP